MRQELRLTARGWLALVAASAYAVTLAAACGDPVAALCKPDAKLFCRCPGGEPGQKLCSEKGDAFGACEGCPDRPDPGEGGGPLGQGGGTGEGPLFRACSDGSECQTGLCQSGYCTVACTKVSDCEYPIAECVPFAGSTVCMPTCKTALDCEPFGTPQSKCGYATATDNWGVTVCAHWGAEHALVPVDTDCTPFDHEDCNLGYPGRELVCVAEGLCKEGCYSATDCGTGTCSSDGSDLGGCG